MKWIAQCHLCGAKHRVPERYQVKEQAMAWASTWEDDHIREEHKDYVPD
jgi:hypothetical protein